MKIYKHEIHKIFISKLPATIFCSMRKRPSYDVPTRRGRFDKPSDKYNPVTRQSRKSITFNTRFPKTTHKSIRSNGGLGNIP